ncbi:MAG: hypothetical protein BWY19_00686 [bacterium ADurb.Bin212]|nr:MAG: hypothetical protein BWY19_00686 [bacterium ADurb.Bin212]
MGEGSHNPEFISLSQQEVEDFNFKPVDALIVLGAAINSDEKLESVRRYDADLLSNPESALRLRLPIPAKLRCVAAAELFLTGNVGDIIFAGGKTAKNKGVDSSEAELMSHYFLRIVAKRAKSRIRTEYKKENLDDSSEQEEEIEARVNQVLEDARSRLVLEDQSESTLQNFANTANLIDQNRSKYQDTGILTNGFHLPRALKIAQTFAEQSSGYDAESFASTNTHYHNLAERYFDPERNLDFRQEALLLVEEAIIGGMADSSMREVIKQRLGSSMDRRAEGEQYGMNVLKYLPEYWLPDLVYVQDPSRLKMILEQNPEARQLVESISGEDIESSDREKLIEAISQVKRIVPRGVWGKPGFDAESAAKELRGNNNEN